MTASPILLIIVQRTAAEKNVLPRELADFLVSAVTRDETNTLAAAQSTVPSIILKQLSKLGSSFMSLSRGESVCGSDEENEDVHLYHVAQQTSALEVICYKGVKGCLLGLAGEWR